MTRCTTLVVLVLICLPALARSQSASDLQQQLHAATGLERARTLAALTDDLRQDQPQQAIAYGQEALELFGQFPDPVNEVKTLNEMGWAYMTLSQYDQAIRSAEKGRDLAERTRNAAGRARAINNLGVIAQRRGEAVRAVEYFTESLKAYREIGGELDISTAL